MTRALRPASRSHSDASGAPKPKPNAHPPLARQSTKRVRRGFLTAFLSATEREGDEEKAAKSASKRSTTQAAPAPLAENGREKLTAEPAANHTEGQSREGRIGGQL